MVIAAVRVGVPIRTALVRAGWDSGHVARYRQAIKTGRWGTSGAMVKPETMEMLREFCADLDQALADFEAFHVEKLAEAAEQVNERTGQRDWRANAWMLEHHQATRENWFQHKPVINMEIRGVLDSPVFREARQKTEAQLLEEVGDPDWVALLGPGESGES